MLRQRVGRRTGVQSQWFRLHVLIAATGVCLLLGGDNPAAQAYSNARPTGSPLVGGPHRVINRLSLDRFFLTLDPTDVRSAYATAEDLKVVGPRIVERSEYMAAPREENVPMTWREWVEDGGFSADEPELFNSFRHFYDPLKRHPDRTAFIGLNNVAYLTDHLAQVEQYLGRMAPEPYLVKWKINVRVDAKSWALTGAPGDGRVPNAYCWDRGRDYFTAAFTGRLEGKMLAPVDRERLYAQSWRALGETAHLLADMTCIPHVRNDSHPGVSIQKMVLDKLSGPIKTIAGSQFDPNMGILRNDPYELYAQEEMVLRLVSDPGKNDLIPLNAIKTLYNCPNPDRLFDVVATFTNRHFFSADTVPFYVDPELPADSRLAPKDVPTEAGWYSANGLKVYPEPALDWDKGGTTERVGTKYTDGTGYRADRFFANTDDPNGYYWGVIWGKKIRLAHRSWLSEGGWGSPKDALAITYPCVNDQASILLPLAVTANARLMDWFVPKLELRLDEVDKARGTIKATLKHIPHGAFEKELLHTDASPRLRVCIDGQPLDANRVRAGIADGQISIMVDRLTMGEGQKLTLELDVAGLRLVSRPAASGLAAWVLTRRDSKQLQAPLSGMKGDDPAWRQTWSSTWTDRPCGGEGVLQAQWDLVRVIREGGKERKETYRGTDLYKTRLGWTCPRRIANVMNLDATGYKLVPWVVAALQPAGTTPRSGKAPPDSASWHGQTTAAIDAALVAPDSKLADRNTLAALMGGMPLSAMKGEDDGVLRGQVQFRFDPQWWPQAYARTHGAYPADLAGRTPGEGWKMIVTLVITRELVGFSSPSSQDKRAYICEYTFDPSGGAVKPLNDEVDADRVKHLGVAKAGEALQADLAKLRLLETYTGPDFAAARTAKPLMSPAGPQPVPIAGATRLRDLKLVPPDPSAEQEIAFDLEVENAPGDASYSWNFGDPPGRTQADMWTDERRVKWTYLKPGTYTITIVVRSKKNYSKILDKQSWQVTVAPTK